MLLCTVQCLEGPPRVTLPRPSLERRITLIENSVGVRTRACACSRVVTKVVRGKEIGAVSGRCD